MEQVMHVEQAAHMAVESKFLMEGAGGGAGCSSGGGGSDDGVAYDVQDNVSEDDDSAG
jgi:hypothetical protein